MMIVDQQTLDSLADDCRLPEWRTAAIRLCENPGPRATALGADLALVWLAAALEHSGKLTRSQAINCTHSQATLLPTGFWDHYRQAARADFPVVGKVSVEASGVYFWTVPFDTRPQEVFSATNAEGHKTAAAVGMAIDPRRSDPIRFIMVGLDEEGRFDWKRLDLSCPTDKQATALLVAKSAMWRLVEGGIYGKGAVRATTRGPRDSRAVVRVVRPLDQFGVLPQKADGVPGRQVAPHWRIDHFCWQRYGPARKYRRWQLRRGSVVNGHLGKPARLPRPIVRVPAEWHPTFTPRPDAGDAA